MPSGLRKMAPRAAKPKLSPDPEGMFAGMIVFVVPNGVQPRRLQIWKQKLLQMGATIEGSLSKRITHVFAANMNSLLQHTDRKQFKQFKGRLLLYEWLENCLKSGERVSEDPYALEVGLDGDNASGKGSSGKGSARVSNSDGGDRKRTRISLEDSEVAGAIGTMDGQKTKELSRPERKDTHGQTETGGETHITEVGNETIKLINSSDVNRSIDSPGTCNMEHGDSHESTLYKPPDLNRNITEIFGKLINIYRALGDERRSFSYYKAIPVIEKLSLKIENADQVKHLPAIGKSMQDHVDT